MARMKRWRENGERDNLRHYEEACGKAKMQGTTTTSIIASSPRGPNPKPPIVRGAFGFRSVRTRTSFGFRGWLGKALVMRADDHPLSLDSPKPPSASAPRKHNTEDMKGIAPSERLKWAYSQTLTLIKAIKSQKAAKGGLGMKGKRNPLDWMHIASAVISERTCEDNAFYRKCYHKFDELKRCHKRTCAKDCDLLDCLMNDYNNLRTKE